MRAVERTGTRRGGCAAIDSAHSIPLPTRIRNPARTLKSARLDEIATAYAQAWSSKSPEAVASFYAEDGQIAINRGDALKGRSAITEMAAGFYAEFPDLVVTCDGTRWAGGHAIFLWTLEGHHGETGNHVKVDGWEEWELDENLKVKSSLGWFDAEEYECQIAEGL